MDDALAAASLLLAALALVYNAWSASIEVAIKMQMGTTPAQIAGNKDAVRSIRNRRARPLAISCWLILVAFVVRGFSIIDTSIRCIGPTSCDYNDIAVMFLLTQVLVLGMAIHMQKQIGRLNKKLA